MSLYGFSLVEVIVALFLLAVGSAIFGGVIPLAVKSAKMVSNHEQASSIVQHKLDQLRGVGYGRLTYTELRNAGIIDPKSTQPYEFTQVDGLYDLYPEPIGTIEIKDFNANIKRVIVTITWVGSAYKQGNGSISGIALIAKN